MPTHSRPHTCPSATGALPWLLRLATRMLARSLSMPEPLVIDTGVFVVAHVQAAETRAAKTLCPPRLMRRLQFVLRRYRRNR